MKNKHKKQAFDQIEPDSDENLACILGCASGGAAWIIAAGTPEEVAKVARSYTGMFLRKLV